jgi:hypothetical protein
VSAGPYGNITLGVVGSQFFSFQLADKLYHPQKTHDEVLKKIKNEN